MQPRFVGHHGFQSYYSDDVHECAASTEIKSVPQCDRQSSILEN
jgi:hypothetical protein